MLQDALWGGPHGKELREALVQQPRKLSPASSHASELRNDPSLAQPSGRWQPSLTPWERPKAEAQLSCVLISTDTVRSQVYVVLSS